MFILAHCPLTFLLSSSETPTEFIEHNKVPFQAFSRQANRLTLNIPVLHGLLRVNSKAKKHA